MALAPDIQARVAIAGAVTDTLRREDVPIESKDVPAASAKTTAAVVDAINASPAVAIVPVESPWTSKINITQAITAIIAFLTAFGLPITDEQKVNILAMVGIFGPVLTATFKTWFTKGISWTSK